MPLGTNPSFAAVKAFFVGPNNFSAYVKGGSYVPNIPANAAISTTVAGLKLSQFSGADKVAPLAATATGGDVTYNLGNASSPVSRIMTAGATISVSGGSGSYTYTWSITSSSNVLSSSISNTTSATPTITATASLNSIGTVYIKCIVSDGTNSVTATSNCTYNYYNTA